MSDKALEYLLKWNIFLIALLLSIHCLSYWWLWDPIIEVPLVFFFLFNYCVQRPAIWISALVVWVVRELKR